MTAFSCRIVFTVLGLMLTSFSSLHAEEGFESLVKKLADDRYGVRAEAKKELLAMCRKQPELIDRLAPIVFDEQDEIERVLNAREVVAEAIYVERGAIGFALGRELIVERMVKGGPAMESGIQIGSQLLSIAGKEAKGMTPTEIYAIVHAARPGAKLEMEFVDKDGEKLLYHPVVAPRSTIRSDENSEQRKQQAYEEWLEKKRKELKAD